MDQARQAVIYFSEMYGADVDLALCIVGNESGFDPAARNPKSSAGGLWQFIDSTFVMTARRMGRNWKLADKFNMAINSEAGAWLLAHDGTGPWITASKCLVEL